METFVIVPSTSRVLWVFVAIILTILIGVAGFLFITARGVPTTQAYSLLLSPQQPERFVERLRGVAPRG